MATDSLITLAIEAARDGGRSVLPHYRQATTVDRKADGSPLTQADRTSHRVVVERLAVSGIPVVSEEGGDLQMEARRYWLVDPLDGTKDFLAGNDEFTVNVALVEDQRPVLGVVYAPALDELCAGTVRDGAWCVTAGVRADCVRTDKAPGLRVAVSRFHDHPDVETFVQANRALAQVPMGSALKYCRLARGMADVSPRLVGSSEWDTAAGQAVLEAAGGAVLDWHTGESLRYGKANRRNPRLLFFRAPYTRDDFQLKHYEPELL